METNRLVTQTPLMNKRRARNNQKKTVHFKRTLWRIVVPLYSNNDQRNTALLKMRTLTTLSCKIVRWLRWKGRCSATQLQGNRRGERWFTSLLFLQKQKDKRIFKNVKQLKKPPRSSLGGGYLRGTLILRSIGIRVYNFMAHLYYWSLKLDD